MLDKGSDLTCRAALAEGIALRLRTAGVRPAVAARVARPGADHAASAAGALDSVLPRVEERRLARRDGLDGRGRRVGRLALQERVRLREPRAHLRREDPDLLLLVG